MRGEKAASQADVCGAAYTGVSITLLFPGLSARRVVAAAVMGWLHLAQEVEEMGGGGSDHGWPVDKRLCRRVRTAHALRTRNASCAEVTAATASSSELSASALAAAAAAAAAAATASASAATSSAVRKLL